MKAILTRTTDDGKETQGKLVVYDDNDVPLFKCDSLERPYLNNQQGVSCIPSGNYNCAWEHMNDLNEDHYEITNVPGRSKIFIHEGNYYTNFEGCVGVGNGIADINGDGQPDILSSKATLSKIEGLLHKQDFQLTIIAIPVQA